MRNEAGHYVGPGDTKLVLWWNLDPEQWPTALAPELESPVPARADEPVVKLGRVFPRGHCRYEVSFEVPSAKPGRYPLVVIGYGGGGAASFQPVRIRVTRD